MLITGYGMMRGMAASNTIIQTIVPEDKRGRVMSYYTMAFVGMAPFGSLLAGGLAHWVGAPVTLMITGAFCIVGSRMVCDATAENPRAIRPIYRDLGILPAEVVAVLADGSGD